MHKGIGRRKVEGVSQPPANAVAGRDRAFWDGLLEEKTERKRVVAGKKRMNGMSNDDLTGILDGFGRGKGKKVFNWAMRHAHEIDTFDVGFIASHAISSCLDYDAQMYSNAVRAIVENASFSLVYKNREKRVPDDPEARRIIAAHVSKCILSPDAVKKDFVGKWRIDCEGGRVDIFEINSREWIRLNIKEASGLCQSFWKTFSERMKGVFKAGIIDERDVLVLLAGSCETMVAGALIGALSAPAGSAGAYAMAGSFYGFVASFLSLFIVPTTVHGIVKTAVALVKSALAARRESRARDVLEGLENA